MLDLHLELTLAGLVVNFALPVAAGKAALPLRVAVIDVPLAWAAGRRPR